MADIEKKDLPEKETKSVEVAKAKDEKKPEAKKAPKKDKLPLKERVSKFFREYKSELKKISWCQPKDVVKYTGVVIVCILIVSLFIGVLDFGFTKLLLFLGGLY